MPNEIEYDPAMHYLVAGGSIRTRLDGDWLEASNNDVYELLNAIYSAAKPKDNDDKPSESSNPPYLLESIQSAGTNPARMTLRSNTSLPLYVEIGFKSDGDRDMYIKAVSGNCTYTFTKPCGASDRHPCHWAVLRGNYGETCVLMGVDESINLSNNTEFPTPYDYHGPDSPVAMRNNLCKYTTPSFFIAHVMDSLTNTTGYSAVLIPVQPNNSIEYESGDPYEEFISYVEGITSQQDDCINTYYTAPSGAITGWIPLYYLVAGDITFYADNRTDAMIQTSLFSPVAMTYQLTAAFSAMSRCVTCSTLMEVWGGTPIPDDTTGEIHTGPEVIVMGSGAEAKYYLRAGNIFVPVSAPPEDPESEDDDEEEET